MYYRYCRCYSEAVSYHHSCVIITAMLLSSYVIYKNVLLSLICYYHLSVRWECGGGQGGDRETLTRNSVLFFSFHHSVKSDLRQPFLL